MDRILVLSHRRPRNEMKHQTKDNRLEQKETDVLERTVMSKSSKGAIEEREARVVITAKRLEMVIDAILSLSLALHLQYLAVRRSNAPCLFVLA